MTHLIIEQNTIPENVTSSVIHKLYETAKAIIDAEEANEVEESQVSLKGNLQVSKAYGDEIDWLEAKFPDLHITAGARYIRFADDAVYARLSQYLGDGTGITISEITNANIFSSSNDSNTGYPYFRGNTSITSFDELRQLPQVTTIPSETFRDASNLTTIDLSNVTSVGSSAFLNCTALTTANLSNYSSIDDSAFSGCTSLTSIDLSNCTSIGISAFNNSLNGATISAPRLLHMSYNAFIDSKIARVTNLGSISNIPEGALSSCSNLISIILPSICTELGKSAIANNDLLETVNVESLVTIGPRNFGFCPLMPSLMYFPNVTTFKDQTYYDDGYIGSTAVRYLYLPKLIAGRKGYDNGGNNLAGMFCQGGWSSQAAPKNIVYLRDITSLYTGAFCGSAIKNLVVNNSTPPTITLNPDKQITTTFTNSTQSRSNITYVYVPDAAVSAYQAADYWKDLTILPISNLNKVATRDAFDALSDNDKVDTLIEEYM